MRQIVQANSASPHFANAAITSAKGKEPVESPPAVSRKQLAAEFDSDLIITFTSSDEEEEEKEEEYSQTDIFGRDYSSSDNDIAEHDDDDIESSDHDDQEQAQAPTPHDNMIVCVCVYSRCRDTGLCMLTCSQCDTDYTYSHLLEHGNIEYALGVGLWDTGWERKTRATVGIRVRIDD